MFPKSTKTGATICAFPDVCLTPTSGHDKSLPLPYPKHSPAYSGATPTASGLMQTALPPGLAAAGINVAGASKSSNAAVAHSLRNKLNQLNQQILSLPGSDPNRWLGIVDEYVLTSAELYKALATTKVT